jgi:pyrroloquinoline quinone biosynthesis protein B
VSVDGARWFLLNASPDVRDQLVRLNGVAPSGTRHVPIEAIVTTDAELDHTIGITLLREARRLQLYSTEAVQNILAEDSRILPVTGAFAEVKVTTLPLEQSVRLKTFEGQTTGLTVTAFPVPGDPPRFARQEHPGHTVGLIIRDADTGGAVAFVPGCGGLSAPLLERLSNVDLLLFDGTFWTDTELIDLAISDRTARQMDHLPVSGSEGSLARIAPLPCKQKVYTHINNSNPMLLEQSPERRAVEAAGVQVGDDGMRFTV